MKKIALFGLGSFAALSMVACTVSETDEGKKNEVSNYEDLPICSTKKNLAGVNYIGQKFYVEEEDAYYLCKETGWTISDASPVSGGDEPVLVIDSNTVAGNAFVGGFFEVGSPIVLRELKLDLKKSELKETGTIFNDEISSANGDFVISNVSLYSNYALLEVTGLYRDMKTGLLSEDSVKLSTIVDMSDSDAVQVNLFSEMALPRVKKLVKDGYAVKAAKVQAEHELLTALGFGGSVEDVDAAMLATAILFRNQGDASDMISAMKAFAEAFAENGTWNDAESKTAYADFAFALQNLKIRDEETDDVVLRTSDYRKNLESFGMAEVPGFETYLTKFWNAEYGLGGCGEASESVVIKNVNEESDSASAYYICKSGVWAIASDFERDTLGLGAAIDGTIMEGSVDAEKLYVYDTTGNGEGNPARWLPIETAKWDEGREDGKTADSLVLENWIGKACTDYEDVRYTVAKTEDADEVAHYWGCNKRKWSADGMDAHIFELGTLCHEGIFDFDKVEVVEVDDWKRYLHCDSTISEDKKDTTWNWIDMTKHDNKDNGLCDNDHVDNYGKVITYKNDKDTTTRYARCGYDENRGFGWDNDAVNYAQEADYKGQKEDECDTTAILSNGIVCKGAVKKGNIVLYYTWRDASKSENDVGEVCSKSYNFGKVITDGAKTPKYYRCQEQYSQVLWAETDSVNYNAYSKNWECKPGFVTIGEDKYVCDTTQVQKTDDDRVISAVVEWRAVSATEVELNKTCSGANEGDLAEKSPDYYQCAKDAYSKYNWNKLSGKIEYSVLKEGAECDLEKLVSVSGGEAVCYDLFGARTWRAATEAEVLAHEPCTNITAGNTVEVAGVEYKCAVNYVTKLVAPGDEGYVEGSPVSWYATADPFDELK